MANWHVWTVVANRQKRIKEFLSELDDVEEFLYPMAEKEYNTKKGKKTKDIPIYVNYIFIKYNHNIDTSISINACPWISEYIGKCSDEEIEKIKKQDKSKYDELISVDQLEPGTVVKLVGTPFIGWEATVVDINDKTLSVSISILGADRIIKCNIDDVNVQSR
jgi:transcription antitermination factor NusG